MLRNSVKIKVNMQMGQIIILEYRKKHTQSRTIVDDWAAQSVVRWPWNEQRNWSLLSGERNQLPDERRVLAHVSSESLGECSTAMIIVNNVRQYIVPLAKNEPCECV